MHIRYKRHASRGRGASRGSSSDEYQTVASVRDMYIAAQETSPLIENWMLFQHQNSQKKTKVVSSALENAMSVPITSPFLSMSMSTPIFTCTAAVHLAHTAAAVGVVDSTLEVLLASGSAALLLLLPSCSARPVCGADLGRTYRCGSRRPCRA